VANITERQKRILTAIIEEFMESADEVGSLSLVEKHQLGVSPATIRNEMARLMDMGLLEKSHISSGRHPTDQALRLYVSNILNSSSLNPLIMVEIRQGIFRDRFSKESVLNSILQILSEETESVVFLVIDNMCRYWGLSNLFKYEELRDWEKLQRVINILEDRDFLTNMMKKYSGSGVSLLIGEESGIKNLEGCSLVFTSLPFWDTNDAHIGILGSKRMDYARCVPALREVQSAMRNAMKGWN
jgi:transcriptional regulator of heat shock response